MFLIARMLWMTVYRPKDMLDVADKWFILRIFLSFELIGGFWEGNEGLLSGAVKTTYLFSVLPLN